MSKNSIGTAELYFGKMPIAHLSAIFQDQETWFADYRLVEDISSELQELIQFSITKLSEGCFNESEYIKFKRYIESPDWRISSRNWKHQLLEAPLFRQNDLSYLHSLSDADES